MEGLKVIHELGTLSPDTVISEAGLAGLLHKHPVSIRRAVARRELPEPVRLFGQRIWTVQALRDHLNMRLEAAQESAHAIERKIRQLSP
jgi:hypothetical protein